MQCMQWHPQIQYNGTSKINSISTFKMQRSWSDAVALGDITLRNRVCMAALTRERCPPETSVPSPLVAEYYHQRAGAGLMLTEATAWSQRGQGFIGAAGLYNEQQREGWAEVVKRVRGEGGQIFVQLVHAGRVTCPEKNGGLEIWGPSSIAVRQKMRDLGKEFQAPKEMTLQEIEEVKKEFAHSVKLAKQANFSGIQLHGAHGYLVDSFLRTSSNKRTDKYGGSPQNRIRLALQLIDLALHHFQSHRIGIKISPVSRLKDMYDQNPQETYKLLLEQLGKRKIGFVEVRQGTQFYPFPQLYPLTQLQQMPDVAKTLRPHFKGILIDNDSFNPETGLQRIKSNVCDMVSFGKLYISNPDLAERIVNGWPVNSNWDMKTFYGVEFGAKGLIDYPTYAEQKAKQQQK